MRSSEEMRVEILSRAGEADAVIMAAAVADYTIDGGPQQTKLAKDRQTLTLTLTRTVDILAELGRWRGGREHPVLVGFAAETHELVSRARAKLQTKAVDLVVANDVSRADAGFEVETNAATIIDQARATEVPLGSKRELARLVLDRVGSLLSQRPSVTQISPIGSHDTS